MRLTFRKTDKLKSKKLIDKLFLDGESISVFPLKLIYSQSPFEDGVKVKASVSVSKRNFKKAVERNRIKRLLREAYRVNKPSYFNNITTSYALMILYLGRDMPNLELIDSKLQILLSTFLEKIAKDKN